MTLKDAQKQVDDWVKQFKIEYFAPLEQMVCLSEEVGELARELNHRFGPKKKKKAEDTKEVADELADIIFDVCCIANKHGIDLDEAFKRNMDKFYGRDKERYEKKSALIHKIIAVVINNNKFLMVRKSGKDIWTSLGGKIEAGETEEQCLLREIKEELNCNAVIIKKLGDFEEEAVFDDATVRLSAYLADLQGIPQISDSELEEFRFIDKTYKEQGIKFPSAIEKQVIPSCIKEGLLKW